MHRHHALCALALALYWLNAPPWLWALWLTCLSADIWHWWARWYVTSADWRHETETHAQRLRWRCGRSKERN